VILKMSQVDMFRMLSFTAAGARYARAMTVRTGPRSDHVVTRRWLLKAGPADYMLAMTVASASHARCRETP